MQNWWNNLDNNWKEFFSEKISSNYPSDDELNKLLDLDEIYLGTSKINNLYPLRIFNKLKKVNLIMCANIGDIKPLENCINLVSLTLTGTSVKDISTIKNFKKLETLWLSDFVDTIEPLSELFYLKELYFRLCSEISSLQPITKLTSIQKISISDNITDLSPIDHWNNLQRIVCYGVSEREAKRFSNLHDNKIEIVFGEQEKKKMDKTVAAIRKLKDNPPPIFKDENGNIIDIL